MNKYTAQAPTINEAIDKALKELSLSKEDAVIQVVEEGKKGFLGIGQKDAVVSVSRKESVSILEDFLPKLDLDLDNHNESNLTKKIKKASSSKTDSEKEKQEIEIVEETTSEQTKEILKEEQETKIQQNDTSIERARVYIESIGIHMGADPINVFVKQENLKVTFTIDTDKAGIIIGRHGKVLNAIQSLVQVMLHKEAGSKLVAVVDTEDYRERRRETLENLANRTAQRVIRTNRAVKLEPMPSSERKMIHHYLSREPLVATKSEGKEPHRYLVINLVNNSNKTDTSQ